jgi:hypothetical protein
MNVYEECLKAYEAGGQYAVYDWVKDNYPNANWAYCEPCESENPFLGIVCLVCGTSNEAIPWENAIKMVLEVIEEMKKEAFEPFSNYDEYTLEELKQRIV